MLPKRSRLSAQEVKDVLSKGRSARAGAVSARFLPGGSSKASIVVSKAVAKKATERNRLRRAGYRALPTLPRNMHLVLFIQKKDFNAGDIETLCSKLS
jgi:ribonuclease P protein component